MVKGLHILTIVLLIGLATQTDGLLRALSELSAFLLTISLVVKYRQQKRHADKVEAEEL